VKVETIESLIIAREDLTMYDSKLAGENCSCF